MERPWTEMQMPMRLMHALLYTVFILTDDSWEIHAQTEISAKNEYINKGPSKLSHLSNPHTF